MEKYGKVKSFRLDEDDEKLLNECFEKMHIVGDSFNTKICALIGRVHKQIDEVAELRKQVAEQREGLTDLRKQGPAKASNIAKPIIKEQPIKSEANALSKPLSKGPTLEEKEPKEWICLKGYSKGPNEQLQKVQCQMCQTQDFSQWKACQELRMEQLKNEA